MSCTSHHRLYITSLPMPPRSAPSLSSLYLLFRAHYHRTFLSIRDILMSTR
ncbi:hypothetical protein Mapa_004969 [Marchantia paleacea]|nr:hypothetical protein Mapa_004969 [Marchantia paleacea]